MNNHNADALAQSIEQTRRRYRRLNITQLTTALSGKVEIMPCFYDKEGKLVEEFVGIHEDKVFIYNGKTPVTPVPAERIYYAGWATQ